MADEKENTHQRRNKTQTLPSADNEFTKLNTVPIERGRLKHIRRNKNDESLSLKSSNELALSTISSPPSSDSKLKLRKRRTKRELSNMKSTDAHGGIEIQSPTKMQKRRKRDEDAMVHIMDDKFERKGHRKKV